MEKTWLDECKLYNDDSLKRGLFNRPFADLIVTSPPYNIGLDYNANNAFTDNLTYEDYLRFSTIWLENSFAWAKSQCRLCVNVSPTITMKNKEAYPAGADITALAIKAGWKYKTTIIWHLWKKKFSNAMGSFNSAASPAIFSPCEYIIVFYKEQWKKTHGSKKSDMENLEFMSWVKGLWKFDDSHIPTEHPGVFPPELPYRCIKLFSFVGDTVFDPFAGTGTTLYKAIQTGRKAVGVEIDKKYYELAKKIIAAESPVLFK